MRRRAAVAPAQHHGDGRPARVDERSSVPLQLLDLEIVGAYQRGGPFLLDAQRAVRLVQAVHDRPSRRVDAPQELEHADEGSVILEG